jgi:hypothetical protein
MAESKSTVRQRKLRSEIMAKLGVVAATPAVVGTTKTPQEDAPTFEPCKLTTLAVVAARNYEPAMV